MCRYTVWGTRKSKQFAGCGYHGVCSGPAASLRSGEASQLVS